MPDRLIEKEFEYKGYTCMIRKVGFILRDAQKEMWAEMGMNEYWYCGYVRIPVNHPLHGIHYNDLYEEENRAKYGDIECHGGLTYSENETGGWTIGFDCNHYEDSPLIQNEEYVADQCKNIVDQLIQIQQEAKT